MLEWHTWTRKYNEAIDYLNKFKSDDIVLWFGNWCNWDAYAEDNKPEEALKNYVKAAGINKMILLHPFLVKSWKDSF
jgi:hypothetical protein